MVFSILAGLQLGKRAPHPAMAEAGAGPSERRRATATSGDPPVAPGTRADARRAGRCLVAPRPGRYRRTGRPGSGGPGPVALARRPRRAEPEVPVPPQFIFVTGGVASALGKGITAASLGRLLTARGPAGHDAEARPLPQRRPRAR